MKNRKKTLILLLLILIPGVFLDQLTKFLARKYLESGPKTVIKKVFEFRLHKNSGAVWGSFSSQTLLLTLISVVLVAFLLYFLLKLPFEKKFFPMLVSLDVIIAGAVGNMIDRIAFREVTDFLYFSLIDFPIFNVADIYVTCATIFLAILIIFVYKDEDFEWMKKSKN